MKLNQRLNNGSARQYYINQVLGANSPLRGSFKELRLRLLVFLEREPQPEESALIQKMLAAISENDYLTQITALDEDALAAHDINFAISFGKAKASTRLLKWVELPPFDALFAKSRDQRNAAKKTAWSQLQTLRQEMDVWCG